MGPNAEPDFFYAGKYSAEIADVFKKVPIGHEELKCSFFTKMS